MFRKILLPTDASEGSAKAVEAALDVAEKYEADIHVLYVIDDQLEVWDETYAESVVDHVREEGRDEGKRIKEKARERGINVETEIVRNQKAYDAILSYASDNEMDLIVMGTHGRTGLDRMMLGSTTERVLRASDIPVMTVKLQQDSDE